MKCNCGYIYREEFNKKIGGYEVVEGDKAFIEINGHFTVDSDDYHSHLVEISLYACPKCKNVIMYY